MSLFKSLSTISILVIVSACAQPEPVPEPIAPEPVYDKYGNEGGGGCTGGQTAGGSSNCIPPTGQQGYEDTQTQDGGGGDAGSGTGN